MSRRWSTVALLSVLLAGVACGRAVEIKDRALRAISATSIMPREFVYTEELAGRKVLVEGAIEDSFRYKELIKLDGADAAEIIVDDDALAIRIINPDAAPGLREAAEIPQSQIVAQALIAGQWVVDPSGAPQLRRTAEDKAGRSALGPMMDAVSVLDYVAVAINEAAGVKQWREDDIDPAYRPNEDHFPHPDQEEGVRRFDLVRTGIPRPSRVPGAQAVQEPPKVSAFRKMAIYVKGNRIIKVLEEIDVEGHNDFVEARQENKTQLLQVLENIKANRTGGDPIVPRKMSVVFRDLGSNDIEVRQPLDSLTASLRGVLRPIGVVAPTPPPAPADPGQTPAPETETSPSGQG